jgi:hydroxypyruvate isomerase
MLDDVGWIKPLGAEYKPVGPTDASLGWLAKS